MTERRYKNFKHSFETCDKLNADNIDTGVVFSINALSDLDDDEFEKLLGLDMTHPPQAANVAPDGHAETLSQITKDEFESVNWATTENPQAAPRTAPVKSQGMCGSCWAFAATTAQEGMQAIKDNSAVRRLSEQEAVDCVKVKGTNGCGGG